MTSLQKGVQIIQEYVRTLPNSPGVYRMLNERYEALYVGKAKNLKKRGTGLRPRSLAFCLVIL